MQITARSLHSIQWKHPQIKQKTYFVLTVPPIKLLPVLHTQETTTACFFFFFSPYCFCSTQKRNNIFFSLINTVIQICVGTLISDVGNYEPTPETQRSIKGNELLHENRPSSSIHQIQHFFFSFSLHWISADLDHRWQTAASDPVTPTMTRINPASGAEEAASAPAAAL